MSQTQTRHEWAPFDHDVAANAGYLYTTNASLSSRIANARHGAAILAAHDFRGKRVIDIGCGDGASSVELYDQGKPRWLHGLDPAASAVAIARRKTGRRNVTFETASAYQIPWADDHFDVAHLRGVLHHMDRPFDALREALRVARTIVVLEPNGYNLALKVIEKLSRYHREHGEKSYPPARIDRWAGRLGARVIHRAWVCLVPVFCPDWLARSLHAVEPVAEATPVARRLACGAYVMVATR
jgi:ubiquinone/menaquinone biosynthesis C-methylase UbiE